MNTTLAASHRAAPAPLHLPSAPTAVAAAVALAHLRGAATPPDAATALVDALLTDDAPRAAVIAALSALGAERALPLLRRALRLRRDGEAAREIAAAMRSLAFDGTVPTGDALTYEQRLTLATLAELPARDAAGA